MHIECFGCVCVILHDNPALGQHLFVNLWQYTQQMEVVWLCGGHCWSRHAEADRAMVTRKNLVAYAASRMSA